MPRRAVERPAEGVAVGQTWRSQLSVPTPMVMRQARNVVYKLDEVRQSDDGPLAVIKSSYTPADSAPAGWPIPYSGQFQMSGTFGFLCSYEVLGLKGPARSCSISRPAGSNSGGKRILCGSGPDCRPWASRPIHILRSIRR